MSAIGLQPIRMRDAQLRIFEEDSYEASVNQVVFVPQFDYDWHYDWNGEAIPVPRQHRWVVSLGFVQDLSTEGALSTYLIEHVAQQKTLTFSASGMVVAATVLILPGQLGGAIGQIPAATVTLPVYGDPELAPEAA